MMGAVHIPLLTPLLFQERRTTAAQANIGRQWGGGCLRPLRPVRVRLPAEFPRRRETTVLTRARRGHITGTMMGKRQPTHA